jgi:phospholipid/cholesterol/gamma-HCH transport system permease protein
MAVGEPRSVVLARRLPGRVGRVVAEVGQVGQLTVRLVRSAVSQPKGLWSEITDEMYAQLRFGWLPVTVSIAGFCFLLGNFGYGLLRLVGAPNRTGGFFVAATIREIAPFTAGMAMAGVVGTALTADLGARRVREELDALEVLGVDPVRMLVLPRVAALCLMMVAFNAVGVGIGTLMGAVSATVIGTASAGSYFASFFSFASIAELLGSIVKAFCIGLFIGICCAQKGLDAKGGAEGVGRAVNQAVVLCFAAVWIINFIINSIILGTNPTIELSR